jgi:hypothetical protein
MIMALFIVGIVLSISIFFVLRSQEGNLSLLQQTKLANDIVTVLDYNKKFDSLNKNTIQDSIDSVLPNNYNMSFRMECPTRIIQSSKIFPNKFISSGERVVVTDNLDYCVMRYWLWAK